MTTDVLSVVPTMPRIGDPASHEASGMEQSAENKRYQAERTETPENEAPLILLFRAESIFSWAEYLKVNRAFDDDPNPDAGRAAESLDKLTLTDGENLALQFDAPGDVTDKPVRM